MCLKHVIGALEVFDLKQRIITGLVLALIVIIPFWIGGWVLNVLFSGCVFIASYEIVNIFKNKWPNYALVFIPLISALICFVATYYLNLLLPIVSFFILYLVLLTVIVENVEVTEISLVAFVHVILIFAIMSYVQASAINHLILFYVVIATSGTDTGAYFVGSYLGKHKLSPRISPNKTVEGSIGGSVIGTIAASTFAYFVLNEQFSYKFVILAFIITIVGQIGDLLFSAIKRHYGIKDFGSFLPGHGGILDRIDSLLVSYMFLFAVLSWVL